MIWIEQVTCSKWIQIQIRDALFIIIIIILLYRKVAQVHAFNFHGLNKISKITQKDLKLAQNI